MDKTFAEILAEMEAEENLYRTAFAILQSEYPNLPGKELDNIIGSMSSYMSDHSYLIQMRYQEIRDFINK